MAAAASWMWDDAQTGRFSQWNPLRWSPRSDVPSAISELNNAAAKGHKDRPVRVHIWTEDSSPPEEFQYITVAGAVRALQALLLKEQEPEPSRSAGSGRGPNHSLTHSLAEGHAGASSNTTNDHTVREGSHRANVEAKACSKGIPYSYATLDTRAMSLPELASLGKLMIENANFAEVGLYALPPQVQKIDPASWVLEKLRNCAEAMVSGQIETASVGLVQIAVRAVQGVQGTTAGPDETRLAIEIVTSLMLNVGGQQQAQGIVSERLQHFIAVGVKRYNQRRDDGQDNAAKGVLKESARHSMSTVAHALAEVLGHDGAPDMLLAALPSEAPPLAPGQETRLRTLLVGMATSLVKVTSTLPQDSTDAEALFKLRQISRYVLSAAAVLTVSAMHDHVGGLDATVSLASAWIKSFFITCVGVASEDLNLHRLVDFLEIGQEAPLLPDHEEPHAPRQALQAMGASRLPASTSDEVASAVLKRVLEAQSHQEDELFTSCPLLDVNGRLARNLMAVLKTGSTGRWYCFLYDETNFMQWCQQNGTLPETREAFNTQNFRIVQLS